MDDLRIKVYTRILFLGMLFIVSGLFYRQIIQHAEYKKLSEENRLRVIPLRAPRGTILDRNGKPLAKDVLCFNASIIYSQVKDKDKLADKLSDILEVDEDELKEKIEKSRGRAYYASTIAEDVGVKAAVQIEETLSDHPGLFLDVTTKREYMLGESCAHVLGYLGLINRTELGRLKHYGYRMNDLVGRSGIEKQYDNYLKGTDGGKQVEVDSRGREISVLGFLEPVPGKTVKTTLDFDLQLFVFSLLEGRKGVIIAMDPENGAILAMASSPSFDPNLFIARDDAEKIKTILNDKTYPLMNRAIRGTYPPGSVFKVIVASAALEKGKATPETSVTCEGSIKLGKSTFRCWKKTGHGPQTMTDAIKNSCNVFFYTMGLMLGADNIHFMGYKFGLGSLTGVDLPDEKPGLLPDEKWKKKKFKLPWYKGETVIYSIGQGYLLVTPLQVARMMSVFANGGWLVTPFIADKIGGVDIHEPVKKYLKISDYTLDVVREGLRKCVNDKRGTGSKAKLSDVVIAGKTGTSQTSRGLDHGWFAGFAPFDKPKLTVVVFDEYGGKGGYYAAQTARKVFAEAKRLGII